MFKSVEMLAQRVYYNFRDYHIVLTTSPLTLSKNGEGGVSICYGVTGNAHIVNLHLIKSESSRFYNLIWWRRKHSVSTTYFAEYHILMKKSVCDNGLFKSC